MTRVCLIGSTDVNLQYELLSRETSREALSTYDLERPFENSLAVRTVSVGAAVSLCNDLQWYIVRFVDEVLVQEPSISETEWLSRELAEHIRNDEIEPAETGEYLKIYGVVREGQAAGDREGPRSMEGTDGPTADRGEPSDETADADDAEREGRRDSGTATPRLVEPLYVRRDEAAVDDGEASEGESGDDTVGGEESGGSADGSSVPTYDLRDVDETVVVRLTEAEFSP